MNTITQSPYIRNEKRWYFLSVFYARERWSELIIDIMHFYRSWTGLFSAYLFSFSGEYGEHLQAAFASFNDTDNYSNIIQTHFQTFVSQLPSNSKNEFPYGKALWCNYPNNSLVWNQFRLPVYSDQYIRFHQQTMRTALELLENDFSEEAIFSTGLYLFSKALECIGNAEQKVTLSKILHDASADNSYDRDIIKKTLSEIDNNEISEAIESYRNEQTSEYSPELISWLEQARDLLKTVDFNILCHFLSAKY